MTVKEKKDKMRKEIRANVKEFQQEYLDKSNQAILHHFLSLPHVEKAETFFCYVSVEKEPDTRKLIEHLLAQGKRVCVPLCLGNGVMEARQIQSIEELLPAPMNLLEPAHTSPLVDAAELDVILLPCVTADKACQRLGHGGGYYDRYMEKIHCPSICFCRGRLIQEALPTEAFDLPVDMVITEEGIL